MLDSRDTTLMRVGLSTLGAAFHDLPDGRLEVRPAVAVQGGGEIDCGLAGTVMRFLPPVAALASRPTRFFGDPHASARPMTPLLGALASLGAAVSTPYQLPFTVASGAFHGGSVTVDASGSSQFISALLLAAARFIDGIEVRHTGATLPSLPHIEMTCQLLERRGVAVTRPGMNTWRVASGPIAALDEAVEPDLTNAATLLAAALVTGGELTTSWPDGVQATSALADALAAFGGQLSYNGAGADRAITLSGAGGLRGADVDLAAISEFTPAAAALAALAPGPSRIRGVAHIRGHETDRLAALSTELGRLGAAVRQTADGLEFAPATLHGGSFATHADHRMAHAGALIGLVTPGVELDDVTCTTKTLPDFPGLWARLIGREA